MLNRVQLPITVYTIKIWLAAALIAPAVYVVSTLYADPHHDLSGLLAYQGFVFAELVCSGPAWLALYLITRIMAPHVPGNLLLKLILTVAGIGLTILTFIWFDWFWGLKLQNGMAQWMWGNALLIATAIWVFKFPRPLPVQLTINSNKSHKRNDN